MKSIICAAAIGLAALGISSGAGAAVGISLDFGNVAVGYSDGYYDSGHHWHHWGRGQWNSYRHAHPDMAHNWRHDDRHHH